MVLEVLTSQRNKLWWRLRWLWLAIGTWLLTVILAFIPDVVHSIYRNGLYSVIRFVADLINDLLPFPFLYLFVILLILSIIELFKKRKYADWTYWINLVCRYFVWFYFLWGFNYQAKSAQEILQLHEYEGAAPSELTEQWNAVVLSFRDELLSAPDLDRDARAATQVVRNFLLQQGLSAPGFPHVVPFSDGKLRRMGIAGIYIPYTFEAYVDGSLSKGPYVFTAAHEAAHGFGYTNEGECSFIAATALLNSGDSLMQAAASYELLKMAVYDEKLFPGFDGNEVLQDLIEQERKDWEQYRSWISELSSDVNDQYLKFQGVEDGSDSYLRFLELYVAWKTGGATL